MRWAGQSKTFGGLVNGNEVLVVKFRAVETRRWPLPGRRTFAPRKPSVSTTLELTYSRRFSKGWFAAQFHADQLSGNYAGLANMG